MKTNLSSQITLTRIPQKYYRPENAFEYSVLTRLEKVPTMIYESVEEGSLTIAREIAAQIRKKQDGWEKFVLALPGGRSPMNIYRELVRMHKEEGLSFRNVIVFLEYEFYPLPKNVSGILENVKEDFLNHVDIRPENIYAPDATMPKEDILAFCNKYEELMYQLGGIDYMLLGIGQASNVMFNSPGTISSSRTRLVLLENAARKEAGRRFPSVDAVPASVITMGISNMM